MPLRKFYALYIISTLLITPPTVVYGQVVTEDCNCSDFYVTGSSHLAGSVGIGNVSSPKGLLHVFSKPAGASNWSYFEGNVGNSTPDVTVKQGLSFGWNKSGQGESIIVYNKGSGSSPRLDFSSWNPSNSTFTTELSLVDGALKFKSDIGQKILLFEHGQAAYGFGITAGQLNYNVMTNADSHVFFAGGKNDDGTELMRLTGTGLLHVGNSAKFATLSQETKDKYSVWVDKAVVAEDFAIAAPDEWSDFVFSKNYHLRSIHDVADYIAANNHLPDVPSEKEVKANGYEVHDMNKILLQKIEELTLYLIEADRKIESLSREVKELKSGK